jgi:hypothetical protein
LPNIDFHMSLGLMSDVPTATYFRHQYVAMLRHCTKPSVFTSADKAVWPTSLRLANAGGWMSFENPLCAFMRSRVLP